MVVAVGDCGGGGRLGIGVEGGGNGLVMDLGSFFKAIIVRGAKPLQLRVLKSDGRQCNGNGVGVAIAGV